MLHGFVSSAGRYRVLEAVRAEDEALLPKLVPFLMNWEFRPATQDGKAVDVELLLIVPSLGG